MDVHYTIRQLQYFVAVARTGTMSNAATRCHVSQPALSLGISQLERSLGVKLFVRQRAKGAELTPAGSRVLVLAEDLLRQATELQERADVESGSEVDGTLSVGCYTTLAPQFIPPLLTGFGAECPGVVLDFSELAQPELQRELREGMLELALLYEHQLDSDLQFVELATLYPYVLLPADHRLAGADEVSLVDLASEPMIMFDVPPSRENWLHLTRHLGITPLIGHRSHNFELVRCLVGRGIGYAGLFQRPALGLTYEEREVVAKPITEHVAPTRVVLAYPTGTNLTARARRFADFAVQTLRVADEGAPADAALGGCGATASEPDAAELASLLRSATR